MKALLRYGLALLVAATAIAALRTFCLAPYRCSVEEKRIQARTQRAVASAMRPWLAMQLAGQNLAALEPCLNDRATVNQLMIAAVNYRILGQPGIAISLYERAMQFERRPELYLNLGLAQIEAGRARDGVENVVTACIRNPLLIEDVTVYRDVVEQRTAAYREEMERRARAAARVAGEQRP